MRVFERCSRDEWYRGITLLALIMSKMVLQMDISMQIIHQINLFHDIINVYF